MRVQTREMWLQTEHLPSLGPGGPASTLFRGLRSATASKGELALRFTRLHVGAEDGIDAGLIAAFAAEPAHQMA
jgi:hypothetical protein